jgi:hypothetical protein
MVSVSRKPIASSKISQEQEMVPGSVVGHIADFTARARIERLTPEVWTLFKPNARLHLQMLKGVRWSP